MTYRLVKLVCCYQGWTLSLQVMAHFPLIYVLHTPRAALLDQWHAGKTETQVKLDVTLSHVFSKMMHSKLHYTGVTSAKASFSCGSDGQCATDLVCATEDGDVSSASCSNSLG